MLAGRKSIIMNESLYRMPNTNMTGCPSRDKLIRGLQFMSSTTTIALPRVADPYTNALLYLAHTHTRTRIELDTKLKQKKKFLLINKRSKLKSITNNKKEYNKTISR